MPYLALTLYVKKKVIGLNEYDSSDEEDRCTKEILQLEEELFQEDDGAARWPVIQLYRNMLVAVLNTFILNTMYRSVALIPVFLLFVVHDSRRMPIKHIYLNYLQMLTSVCLLIISVCNILPSISSFFDLMSITGMREILKVLKHLELALMAMVPLSLPIWKLSDKIEEKRVKELK